MWTRTLILTLSVLTLALPACALTPEEVVPRPKPDAQAGVKQAQKFARWKQDFKRRAIAQGYDRAMVTRVIDAAKINPLALDRDRSQPEFVKPVWSYVDGAASADRITRGKTKLSENAALFSQIEARYGVPRYVLTAIWGLETSYGRIMGSHDIVSSLATFAFDGRRMAFGDKQLFAVLDLLSSGEVREDQLIGSWASAMGMTQFIPTTFRDYAVDFDGNGHKDLWGSAGDALGSAANYLSRSGWQRGGPVLTEVELPSHFDYTLSDGRKKTIKDWSALGVIPQNGQDWAPTALNMETKLLIPAGERGPKMLTFKNFDAIKRYNNSTSYVLGITTLADAYQGKTTLSVDWPRGQTSLTFSQRKQLQQALTARGYDTKGVDGQIGPNSRRAIRAFQTTHGLVADGFATQSLLKKVLNSKP